jgi:pSer/pThr/pTyr-binding forkhead associated (FHA) protein
MNLTLSVTDKASGDFVSLPLAVEKRTSIGRYLNSPVPLQGIGLSRDHFALEVREGALYVEDLSSNGTWLNGQRLPAEEAVEARNGDLIEVPGYSIEISITGLDAQPEGSSVTEPASKKTVAPWISALRLATGFFSGFEVVLIVSAFLSFALIVAYASR